MATSDLEINSAVSLPWNALESQPPTGERLTVRLALPQRRADLFIGIDASVRRHILVTVPAGELRDITERSSRGIGIQTIEMKVNADELTQFVQIVCFEPQGHAALDTIVYELADALDAGASINRIALVQNVIFKWRRFWSGVDQGLLTLEQQLGLFGELWFLNHWLGPSIGLPQATQFWRGSLGSRNDFEAPTLGIEIKTTGRVDAIHRINGLDQLLEPANGSLFLMSLVVRDEASATDSLPELVKCIRASLVSEYEILSRFDTCLYAAGYQDVFELEYAKLKLRVRSEELYHVKDDFPRIVPASFISPLHANIDSVTYELRLDSTSKWCLSKDPKKAVGLIQSWFHGH